jgi:hypothetical protein
MSLVDIPLAYREITFSSIPEMSRLYLGVNVSSNCPEIDIVNCPKVDGITANKAKA